MSRRTAPAAMRWTAYIGVAIVFAIACAFLSNWQFSRNAERAEQLALVAANFNADPVPLGDVIPTGGALDPEAEWTPVELTGHYLVDDQLLVRNRVHAGTAAFEVLVPFVLDDERVLLINRGWVPPGETQPEPDAVPAPPDGVVTVIARVRPSESLPPSGKSAPEGQVPTINLALVADRIEPQAAESLELSAYGLMESEDPTPATRPAAVEAPSDDPGPHLSYAIQWILFAVMGFVFIGYVIRTEVRHRRDEAEGRTSAPKRRRDRDAVDEDALLDSVER